MRLTTPRLLERCPMFAKLASDDHQRIADVSEVRVFKRNEVIFQEGDPARSFYIVLDGDVKVFKSSQQGKEQTLHRMTPFNTFAEAAVFLQGGYPASAIALHETRLLEIPRDKFLDLIRSDPEMSLRVLASMSVWLHRMVNLVEDLSFSEVPVRIARHLIRLAADGNVEMEDGVTVTLPTTKTEFAKLVGTAQETLSRALSKIGDEGVISIKGRNITIKNAALLKEMAGK
jgi:CRP/FNR family transcriptional regulator, dissimilatory nitrate respiration regulator